MKEYSIYAFLGVIAIFAVATTVRADDPAKVQLNPVCAGPSVDHCAWAKSQTEPDQLVVVGDVCVVGEISDGQTRKKIKSWSPKVLRRGGPKVTPNGVWVKQVITENAEHLCVNGIAPLLPVRSPSNQ